MNVEPKDFINSVIKAYAKTGLIPQTGRMFIRNKNCACALGVLYCEANGIPDVTEEDDRLNLKIWNWAKITFGDKFVSGFWRGFDRSYIDWNSPFYDADKDAYDLGVEINNTVVGLYNKGELYG